MSGAYEVARDLSVPQARMLADLDVDSSRYASSLDQRTLDALLRRKLAYRVQSHRALQNDIFYVRLTDFGKKVLASTSAEKRP